MRSRILVGLITLGLLVGLSVAGAVADSQPTLGRLELPMPQTMVVQGQYAYIFKHISESDPVGALYVVDVSQSDTPTLVGQTEAGGVGVVDIQTNYLYVGEDDGISVFDVADPANPRRVGHVVDIELGGTLRVAGDYLYISGSDLWIFNVSDPTQPVQVAKLSDVNGLLYPDPPHLYVVSLYLTDVDISDPTHPVILSQTSLGYWVRHGTYDASTKHLYYWNEPYFELPVFAVVDVTNPQPRILRREVPNVPLATSLENGLLYALLPYVDRPSALEVYRLSNPEQPALISTVEYPPTFSRMFVATVSDGVVYALRDDGLYTLRLPHFLPFRSFLPTIEVLKGAAG